LKLTKKEVQTMCKKKSYVVSAAIVVAVVTMLFFPVTGIAGSLDPATAPAPTMKTLDQIPPTWDQILPANDSTTSDGCNSSRFKCVMGGAGVLDKETGLVWEKSPSTTSMPWEDATDACRNKSVGQRKGWRVPTVEQLASLVDPLVASPGPTLPIGHPFTSVQSAHYWSATTYEWNIASAWFVSFVNGSVNYNYNPAYYVWCVRGGQSHDRQ
jgi:hypothetical protein